ncbi:MAG: polysaccharide deacetylase family protein [Flavobacteriaceae bacterium]|nr:polysaccharide deacetylase family protein [Flavobacteriaceae bacterium]
MKPYLVKTPKLVQWIFPRRVWAFSRKEPKVYLTFDDGPIPEVTPWVLEVLRKYDAKATFFCIGDNIHKHPEVYKQILAEGHSVGNHTFHHLKGTETSIEDYIAEVEKCEHEMLNQQDSNSKNNLFRPPYGKMTAAQAKRLQDKGYQIVMWDVLSADFDVDISEEKCLQNVLQNIKKGSVVVFHDSLKAEKNLRYVLPKVLEYLTETNLASQRIT